MTLESARKNLSELRVVDLKKELEKRQVDCSGVKNILVKKLEKALVKEGENPETFEFFIDSSNSPVKKSNATSAVNRVDKSDDEKQLSDDEIVGNEGEPTRELSDDEKLDDLVMNDLSDDEKQDDEYPTENVAVKQVVEEDTKVSDDEEPNPEDGEMKSSNKDLKDAGEEELSDDQIEEDEDEDVEMKEVKAEPSEEVKTDLEETDEGIDTESTENQNSVAPDTEEKDNEELEKCTKSIDSNGDSTKESTETSKTSPKKLRPRITAPSEDNTTKTPVLKKDIKLPISKPKDEEFVVPEKESDIYDKEKFIVKDDTVGDDEVMDFEVDMSNMDSEDSINLTIGEEDAKFMTEEAEKESDNKDAMEERQAEKKKGSSTPDAGNKQQTSSFETGDPSKAKSLWVSGLSSATRATDLKHLFTKHGKVIAAKIVTNAKTPGARCYGFVTMATHEDAGKCIKALNLTELHGRLISVEPVADKPAAKKLETENKSPHRNDRDRLTSRSENIRRENVSNGDRRYDRQTGRESDRRRLSRERDRGRRYDNHQEILSFEQIKAERKKQKALAVEREMRELNRRKRDEISRQRDVERRNREEALRLEREREKLKYEREKIERERAELLLLERARLEREKEELKRQKLRLEEDRILKRSMSDRVDYNRVKRPTPEFSRHFSNSSSHRSPARNYDRLNDRGVSSSKRDSRRESKRSRSPHRRSRPPTSSKSSGKKQESGEDSAGRICYYCGLASHSRRDCPATNVPCPICGKAGHFGSMCSVLGYKYPEPVYFEGFKRSGGGEKWSQGGSTIESSSRSKNDCPPWNRSDQAGQSSDRWSSQTSGSVSSGNNSRMGNPYSSGTSLQAPISSSSINPYPQDRFDNFSRKY